MTKKDSTTVLNNCGSDTDTVHSSTKESALVFSCELIFIITKCSTYCQTNTNKLGELGLFE